MFTYFCNLNMEDYNPGRYVQKNTNNQNSEQENYERCTK